MIDNIFALVYSDYDTQDYYFFNGPEGISQEDFEKLCGELIPKAGYRAALQKLYPKEGGWICWRDVVESLISLLEQQGYQRISLDSYRMAGGNIIGISNYEHLDGRLGFAEPIIVEYNRKLEKKMAEERENKRGLRLGTLKKRATQIIK